MIYLLILRTSVRRGMMMNNYLAGGANSPIPNWEGYPELVVRGKGAEVFDVNDVAYIDTWMGYGALLFGHAPDFLKPIFAEVAEKGWFFSYPTLLERKLAEKLHDIIPCAERVRFATTGSDAVAYAIRAARQYTGRSAVIKVGASYHGVHENLVSAAGAITDTVPTAVQFNSLEEAEGLLCSRKFACLIVEPILANGGTVPPKPGYLASLRKLCTETDTVLIFDEVVTGFRINLGGAQREFGITPDVATFSKSIAGALPLSAICGKKEILDQFMPKGEVLFAGTFNGSPIALQSALAFIDTLLSDPPHKELDSLRGRITQAITEYARSLNMQVAVQGYGSMFSIAFDVDMFEQGIHTSGANQEKYIEFVKYLAREHRLLLPPLYTETIFLSVAHLPHEAKIIESLCAGLRYISEKG